MNRRLSAVLILCVAAIAALPTYASARTNQVSIIQDDAKVIASGDAVRSATLDEMRNLGADVLKISISWRALANAGKPSNPDDPGAYPAAKWAPYDAAIQGAVARGLTVFLNVGGPAPGWATGGRSKPVGAYRPNASAFGHFVKAVDTRYSGSYAGLPRVGMWSVWNEPNLPVFLLPQRSSTRS